VTLLGKIFILLDYPVVFANPTLESDHLISLDVEEPVYNLAFAEGRAVFTTVRPPSASLSLMLRLVLTRLTRNDPYCHAEIEMPLPSHGLASFP
jgi:hypothetical protein